MPGPSLPDPEPQSPPKNGTGSRLDCAKATKKLDAAHRLIGWRGGDGYPFVVPVGTITTARDHLAVHIGGGRTPPGGRRAAILAHEYRPQLIGLRSGYALGWLDVDRGRRALLPAQDRRLLGSSEQDGPAPRQRVHRPPEPEGGPEGGSHHRRRHRGGAGADRQRRRAFDIMVRPRSHASPRVRWASSMTSAKESRKYRTSVGPIMSGGRSFTTSA